MDAAATELQQPKPGEGPTPDPRDRAHGLSPDAPQAARDVARGHEVNARAELSAVRHLLGQQRAPRYAIPVQFATDDGDATLWFTIKALDSNRIDKIEKAHTDTNSVMGEADTLAIAAELVADATIMLSDAKPGTPEYVDCGKTDPSSAEFLAERPAIAEAFRERFHWQEGLLSGVSSQIRRISGWAPDRVGQAERVLVDVAGGS
jgi:hypothetical protein